MVKFSILFNLQVCCVFSLESPHRGNFNENTQYTIFNLKKKKITLIILNLQPGVFFPRNSRTSSKQQW